MVLKRKEKGGLQPFLRAVSEGETGPYCREAWLQRELSWQKSDESVGAAF